MKKLGFISWYALLASTSITLYIDWKVVLLIMECGGFNEWQAANSMWDLALAYLTMWHIFYAVCIWLVYECNND